MRSKTSVAVVTPSREQRERLAALLEEAGARIAPEAAALVLVVPCRRFRAAEAAVVRRLKQTHADARVLVVTATGECSRVRAALAAGANGLIADDGRAATFAAALSALAAGLLCLPAAYARLAARPTFTAREREILALVIVGLSNGEIGRKLYLAESTVKSHLSSAFTKLGVGSRSEATALILDPASGLSTTILRASNGLVPASH
jgi:DNA-binding NarL/FixJ family response regulator